MESDRYEKISFLQYSDTAYDAKSALSNRSRPNEAIPCIQHAASMLCNHRPQNGSNGATTSGAASSKMPGRTSRTGLDSPLLIRIPIRAAEDGGVRVLFRFVAILHPSLVRLRFGFVFCVCDEHTLPFLIATAEHWRLERQPTRPRAMGWIGQSETKERSQRV